MNDYNKIVTRDALKATLEKVSEKFSVPQWNEVTDENIDNIKVGDIVGGKIVVLKNPDSVMVLDDKGEDYVKYIDYRLKDLGVFPYVYKLTANASFNGFSGKATKNFNYKVDGNEYAVTPKADGSFVVATNIDDAMDLSEMFQYTDIVSLDISLNTPNVTNLFGMVRWNGNTLKSVTFTRFDTSKVSDMSYMFDSGMKLTSLDLSIFDTSNVTTLSHMFLACYELRTLDLSMWDTSNLTNIGYMFTQCNVLTDLNLYNWNTSKVTFMEATFYHCHNLATLDLSGFDVSNVTTMEAMFSDCYALETLNLSNWNASKTTNMANMFRSCRSLTNVIGPITGIKANLSLSDCPLTQESAKVFLDGLEQVSSKKTITFKSSTHLAQEDVALATSKGWTVTGGIISMPDPNTDPIMP